MSEGSYKLPTWCAGSYESWLVIKCNRPTFTVRRCIVFEIPLWNSSLKNLNTLWLTNTSESASGFHINFYFSKQQNMKTTSAEPTHMN